MTPLRALAVDEEIAGVRVAPGAMVSYRDGAEAELARILSTATDLSSGSEELELAARTWAEQYHLCRQRSNFLRWFDLAGVGAALDVGAGCGAVTRYLGESVPVVDAVEPVLGRATVAAARCRDLDSVQVFSTTADQIPLEATYDLIVVCGVLEYVGLDDPDPSDAWHRFLGHLAGCLTPTGRLILAIENQLGVKYLAGAPEDHSGVPFDGLTGYLGGRGARTVPRAQLERLVGLLGLEPLVLGAFPDYKLTQVLLGDRAYESEPSLAYRLPTFPSPDWGSELPRTAVEAAVWRTLVQAGVARDFPNSFVVCGSRPGASATSERVALRLTNLRRNLYATQTEVVTSAGGGLEFRRSLLHPGEGPQEPTLVHRVRSEPFEEGRDFAEVFGHAREAERRTLLMGYLRLVDAQRPGSDLGAPVDLVPTNLLVRDDGSLVPIDQEWFDAMLTLEVLRLRGLALLARRLVSDGHDIRLSDLCDLAGQALTPGDQEALLVYELRFRGLVHLVGGGSSLGATPRGLRREVARDLTLDLLGEQPPSRSQRMARAVRAAAGSVVRAWRPPPDP